MVAITSGYGPRRSSRPMARPVHAVTSSWSVVSSWTSTTVTTAGRIWAGHMPCV